MQLHFIIYFILLAREDLQQQEPSNTVLSYLFAPPARMEGTLKNYIKRDVFDVYGHVYFWLIFGHHLVSFSMLRMDKRESDPAH